MSLHQGQIDEKTIYFMLCELLKRQTKDKELILFYLTKKRLDESLQSYAHDLALSRMALGSRKSEMRVINRLNKNV